MYPKQHLIFNGLLLIVLLIFFPQVGLIKVFLILLSNSLVDADHYLYYVYHKKDWSLKNSYRWFIQRIPKIDKLSKKEQGKYKKTPLIFHGIEFLAILIFLSFLHPLLLWVLLGVVIHTVLDIIEQRNDKELVLGKISQIYVCIKNKNKKEFKFKIKKQKIKSQPRNSKNCF